MTSPHVLIIGAGLAGPSMALALARHHIRSSVFERRTGPNDVAGVGGVLMLSPNAINVLDKVMGVERDIRPLGFTYDRIEMHATSGTEPMYKLGDFGRSKAGDPQGLTIKRPVLHGKLLELCQREKEYVTVEFGKRLVDVREDANSVTAVFDDGTTATGDILLGIDGIHSRVRQHVLGGVDAANRYAAQYTGDVVLGGIIEKSKLPKETGGTTLGPPIFIYTQAGTILSFPTDAAGEHIQWATFVQTPERPRKEWEEYKASGDALKDLRQAWKGVTAEPINTLLNNLEPNDMNLWAPYAIPAELPTWHTNRTCMIGDSVHAISPSGGQGTAQALEDVGYLSMLLGSASARERGYRAIFEQYEAVRRVRLEDIRKMTDRSLGTKRATPSSSWWWIKKTGLKAVFSAMSTAQSFGFAVRNPMQYDVTKEKIAM